MHRGLLLVAASIAALLAVSSAGAKTGGTFVAELSTDVDYVDPGLDYLSSGWEIQYATGCKLLNYPDTNGARGGQLVPEVAAGFPKVSNNGKTYTFTVRKGFRFADGSPVTAQSFADAFNRDANPKLQSPAQAFVTDILGATAVLAGQGSQISGIVVKGNTITFRLTHAAPDLLSRVAMPFFQAIPKDLSQSLDPNGANVIKSCGPYYIADRVPNKSITIKRNPYYKGPRPHNVNQIVYRVGNTLEVIRQNVENGQTDYAAQGLDPQAWKPLFDKYGINKGRVFVNPILGVQYIAMNTSQPLFKNNPNLRKAVNYAIDRRALLSQSGYLAGKRNDQYLPPGLPGYKEINVYPSKGPNLAMAKKLAAGHTGNGKAILFTSNRGSAPLRAQIIQYDLAQIGIEVQVQQLSRAVQIEREGTRGAQFDLTDEAWQADYADPYDFINVLLNGKFIQDANNNNYAYLNDPTYNAMMDRAALLFGSKRYQAYATLDAALTKDAVPWASRANPTNRNFVSARTGCFTYNVVYGPDLSAICLK
jgi:ABC-type oligopeptide transport system substrate-binding subunit